MPPEHPAVLDHVAVAVPEIDAATPFLVGELGARPCGSGPGPGYRFLQWSFARDGKLEVLQPDGPPDGFLHRFLASCGPGLHHVTFKVASIHDAMARAVERGYDLVGVNVDGPGWKEAFLHPKQAQGIVVQLAESHAELKDYDESRGPFPELPDAAPERADLVGLRLVARSAERARQQWHETLLGEASESDGTLVFRWPHSPLRIAVRIDPGAPEEGPLGIEIAPPAGLALPEDPHPLLGTALLRGDGPAKLPNSGAG